MSNPKVSVTAVDALLPQTQCGLCEYPACKPYAQAIVDGEVPIDRCLPGGESVLLSLADLLQQDASDMLPSMRDKQKPASVALVREDECIGCTKCIQACPVDAIIGSVKLMHTIITDACSGCELCIPPCPVDCIDMLPVAAAKAPTQQAEQFRASYVARQQRLAIPAKKVATASTEDKQQEITAAVARVRNKRLSGNHHHDR